MLAPVAESRRAALGSLLARVNEETIAAMQGQRPASILPFAEVPGLHFARFVMLPFGERWMLAFATDYDGAEGLADAKEGAARDAHIGALVKLQGVRDVFAHCEGCDPGDLAGYFARHARAARTAFVAAPGRSVAQIRWEASLRRRVEEVLRAPHEHLDTPEEVRTYVIDALGEAVPKFPPQPDLSRNNKRSLLMAIALSLATLFVIAVALTWLSARASLLTTYGAVLAATLVAVGLGYLRLRWLEAHDRQFQPKFDADTHRQVATAAADENHFLQNQLTHVVQVKPGILRWLLIRGVFAVLGRLTVNTYNRGKLGDIPSIHFARWVLGPARSVIFFSNFDSSWQSYLGDFIDKASSGLTAVWSNTVAYPRTRQLLRAGSRDAGRFLAWTRAHQLPTQVWYSAYPGLSVVNINSNTAIRRGLAEPRSIDAVTWLALLRNVDRAAVDARYGDDQARHTPLDLDDIQGIILKGYGHKPASRTLLFALGGAPSRELIDFLATLEVTSVTEGGKVADAQDPLLNVAFTHAGLRALGIEATLCDAFSTPFVQGASHVDRARLNGDVGADAPEAWRWGSDEHPVHIALMLFARDDESLATHVQRYRDRAEKHGLSLVGELEGGTLPGRKEHFGFRDGIAQPTLHGSGDPAIGDNAIAPGEVLLGHPDGYGNLAVAPLSARGFRFGFNGSYMVLRQLEQNVPAFWRYCAAQAAGGPLTAIQIASKLVGRWPSGAPLVRYPEADPGGASDDDNFGYFEIGNDNDRFGGRCPFGAHIRRSNPRDWGLGENADESVKLSNLHRIMRRGRPYGPPLIDTMAPEALSELSVDGASDQVERGMQFICFNANIERQFEFIQQHWCKNPKFAGQVNDADPVLGGPAPFAELGLDAPGLTLQSDLYGGASKRLSEFASFVRVRGAAYLFMPGISSLRLLPELTAAAARTKAPSFERVPDDEQAHIDHLQDNIRLLLQRRYQGEATLRDAHPKAHGCVRAELVVSSESGPEIDALRHGLFATKGAVHRGWVRFSNQSDRPTVDQRADTRGLALKLLDIPGAKLLDGKENSREHDFVFLSTPTFVARDVAEFDALIQAVVHGGFRAWIRAARQTLRHKRSVRASTSPLATTYFSVVPALIGPHAVKYIVEPDAAPMWTDIPKDDPNFLRTRLRTQLAKGEATFGVYAVPFVDHARTPIEDPTVRWDTERVRLATLTILQQDDFDTPLRDQQGESLSFNPFRCLPEHRPLGGISRARRQIYLTIARFRHVRNGVTKEMIPDWEP